MCITPPENRFPCLQAVFCRIFLVFGLQFFFFVYYTIHFFSARYIGLLVVVISVQDVVYHLYRSFRILDKNRSDSIDKDEFRRGLEIYQIEMSDREIDQLYDEIDRDRSGKLSYKEFITILRPPMNQDRTGLIHKAFDILDSSGDGQLTVSDLKTRYSVEHHPKYLSGEWTADQCLREFLDNFDSETNKDGVVTRDEFLDYYSGVSAFIDKDEYFVQMMRHNWGIM